MPSSGSEALGSLTTKNPSQEFAKRTSHTLGCHKLMAELTEVGTDIAQCRLRCEELERKLKNIETTESSKARHFRACLT